MTLRALSAPFFGPAIPRAGTKGPIRHRPRSTPHAVIAGARFEPGRLHHLPATAQPRPHHSQEPGRRVHGGRAGYIDPMVAGALARIERAFSAALARLEAAETFADAEDEVSNALHHLYRLWELAQRSQGAKRECLPDVTQVLLCLRGADTHQVVRISHGATRLPRTYPLSYKVPIFDLIDNRGIDDPKLQAAFLKSVRGRAADKLLPEAFKEIRSLIK